ncbi:MULTISPECIES: M15 family metallopeptidase [Sulfurospirillum]|uniref:D-alanyl-D-alanine carboxypeptidase n=3 Tax=Sulfurospirillum TaxID=57665 RepID=A0AA86AR41_SULMK|nr:MULTISPECIES: M15 family metallopeptidase [Sulfurospirillum]AHJ14432.1 putative D-alanyl-D-alanine carboxypeptidase [Sulfurospirillum multivorans DSM 12446]AOO66692.1 putative D-alanyl-D-alanine carboxypeptidase [Sulfurospirillum halorespirans DSM 13726]QEH07917.1 putative D-alanyl-D-alanine carboxypeptidase [Sulfurospirillum multivorans]
MIRRDFLGVMGATLIGSLAQADELKHPDIWIKNEHKAVFESVIQKLDKVEHTVGYANFNLISFDETLKIAKNFPKIGAFTPTEIAYMEEIFYTDPVIYGFYGKRTIEHLSDTIQEKDVIKIDGTGHYVYRDISQELLLRLMKDIGPTLVLTSGVRSVVKQLSLHLEKIKNENGNITMASRSLVPPGFSYHSVGDFDVGKRGWGHQNFTANFARTEEFWNLQKLSYVSTRYTIGNGDGVRFEPWHVKIV